MPAGSDFDDVIQGFSSDDITHCVFDVRKVTISHTKTGTLKRSPVHKGEILLSPGKGREYYDDILKEQWGGGEYRLYPKDVNGEQLGNKIIIIEIPLNEEEKRMTRLDDKVLAASKEQAAAEAEEGAIKAKAAKDETERKIQEKNQPEEKKELGITDIIAAAQALAPKDGGTDLVAIMQMQMQAQIQAQTDRIAEDDRRRIREEDKEDKRRVREEDRRREDEKIRKEERDADERNRKDEREKWETELKLREKEIDNEREKTNKLLEMKNTELAAERADRRKAEAESQKTQLNFLNVLAKKDQDNSQIVTTMINDNLTQVRKMTESQINMTDKHIQSGMASLDMLRDREGFAREEEQGGVLNEIAKGAVDLIKAQAQPRQPLQIPVAAQQPASQPEQVNQLEQKPAPAPQPQPQPQPQGVSLDGPGGATVMIQQLAGLSPAWIQSVLASMRDKNVGLAVEFAENLMESEYASMAAIAVQTSEWPEIKAALATVIHPDAKKTLAVLEEKSSEEWWAKFKLAISEISKAGFEEEPEEPAFTDGPEEEVLNTEDSRGGSPTRPENTEEKEENKAELTVEEAGK